VFGQDCLDALITQLNFQSLRASSSNPDLNSNGDALSIAAGETVVLADLQGPGLISHIWATVGSAWT
jgi:hypothetical protein